MTVGGGWCHRCEAIDRLEIQITIVRGVHSPLYERLFIRDTLFIRVIVSPNMTNYIKISVPFSLYASKICDNKKTRPFEWKPSLYGSLPLLPLLKKKLVAYDVIVVLAEDLPET